MAAAQFLVEGIGHVEGTVRPKGVTVHDPEGFRRKADHIQQSLAHPQRGGLNHQLDFSGKGDQLLQGHQCHIGTEAGGEDAQILHMGEVLTDPPGHGYQGIHTVAEGEHIGGIVTVAGEIEPDGGGGEHLGAALAAEEDDPLASSHIVLLLKKRRGEDSPLRNDCKNLTASFLPGWS